MPKNKKPIDPDFKNKLAWEALGGKAAVKELAIKHDLDPELIKAWRQELLDEAVAEVDRYKKKGPVSDQDVERILKKKFGVE